jgi:hypothetical protein
MSEETVTYEAGRGRMAGWLRWRRVLLVWRARRLAERAALGIAWRLPGWLVCWATIRCIANATTGRYGTQDPTTLGAMEVIGRWEKRMGGDRRWAR